MNDNKISKKNQINEKGIYFNEIFMKEALNEAKKALYQGEVPVGAVIVKNGTIIGRGHNTKEENSDVTGHAEICAIRNASLTINDWRLSGCDMYVTLEPCPMCAAAIAEARMKKLYIGTFDQVMGACGTVMNLVQDLCFNHFVNVEWLYNEECSRLITDFFEKARKGI